jgi:PmbA protein
MSSTSTTNQLIERVLSEARKVADEAEVYALTVEETPVRFEANRLKSLMTRQTSGLALRVIKNGRMGFASSTRQDDVENLVAIAVELSQFGAQSHFHFPSNDEYGQFPSVNVFDPATLAVQPGEMVEIGQTLIDQVRAANANLLCDGSVRKASYSVEIANSRGGRASYEKSHFSVSVEGQLVNGTDMLFVGDSDASCSPIRDTDEIARTTLQQLEWAREIVPSPSGQLPVIFTPQGIAGALIAPLLSAFNGRTVWQGASPVGQKLDEQVYDQAISVWDDGTLDMAPGAEYADDEGVPTQRTALIESGVVRNFLYDLQSAGLAGKRSTGNAGRSLASQPGIQSHVLVMDEGDITFEQMLRNVNDGLVVDYLMGAGQGNVQGGEFSGNVLLGYRVQNGQIVGRVKNTMVAGNIHEALANLIAVGSEARLLDGHLKVPHLCFAGLSVSGGD